VITLVEDSAATRRADVDTDVPRRAAGLELLGRFEGSGFKDPPYLVRRSDGQVIQLSPLLYALGEAADGRRQVDGIAEDLSARLGRRVSSDNVRFLVERKLRPLGVVAEPGGSRVALEHRPPPLALRHRRPLVPERIVQRVAGAAKPIFWPPVVLAVVAALVVFDAWLFFSHGVGGALRSAIYNPTLLLGVFASVILATAFHEVGHAAACRYGGARPGAIGAGLYLIWPAFYCDVTDAYRLGRGGRVRTDLGGVYFNAVFALLAGAAFFATGIEALLLVAVAQHFVIVQQLLPLLRFDGYYVLSDITGVPDILSRIGAIFRSLLPWRETEPRVAELKPWVRVVVSAYVATLIPMVVLLLSWLVLGAPRLFATIFDSLAVHADRAGAAAGDADWPAATLGLLQVGALLLPCTAVSLTFGRLLALLSRGVRHWAARSMRRKLIAIAAAGVAAGSLVAAWWPDDDYRPLRPAERVTLGEIVSAPEDVPGDHSVPTPSAVVGAASHAVAQPADDAVDPSGPGLRVGEAPRGDEVAAGLQPGVGDEPTEPDDDTSMPAPATGTAPAAAASPAPEPSPSAEPAASPVPDVEPASPENQAQAVNTTDGARVFELAFDIQRVLEGPVTHENVAQAYASCQACRTIAIAVQVVLVMADVDYAVPVNYAEAINYACEACETLAFAWQLVISTGGEVGLTADALERIAAIELALDALKDSDAPIADIEAAADQLMDDLRNTIMTGTQPVGEPTAPAPLPEPVPNQETESSPEPSPSPDAEATPAPEETPIQEPAPSVTPDLTPAPTATPESTPTAAPSPTPTP
jgi:putative peptide zinc metalloprotease protein